MLCVLATTTSYAPVPFFASILYPVGAPPEDDAVQERFTCVGDAAVAVRPVGVPGAPADDELGVASADAEPVPIAFIADTRYVYTWPAVSPVCEYVVDMVPVFADNVV